MSRNLANEGEKRKFVQLLCLSMIGYRWIWCNTFHFTKNEFLSLIADIFLSFSLFSKISATKSFWFYTIIRLRSLLKYIYGRFSGSTGTDIWNSNSVAHCKLFSLLLRVSYIVLWLGHVVVCVSSDITRTIKR